MPTLAPSPSRPIGPDQRDPQEGRSAIAHGPDLSTVGPPTSRDEIRNAMMARATQRITQGQHAEPPPHPATTPVASTESATRHTTATAQSPQPEARQMSESATLPETTKLGFFAAMKERLLKLTGLMHAPKGTAEDAESEPKGFLAAAKDHLTNLFQVKTVIQFGNWALKAVSLALAHSRPERPVILSKGKGECENKGARLEDSHHGNGLNGNLLEQQDSARPLEIEKHYWDSGNVSVDLTVQALNVVAEATRAEQAKEKKKHHDSFEEHLRRKETTRDTLKRSAVEGIRGVDAAPILRELDGVYGTVEVAERQFRDLAERRRKAQG